MADVAVIRKRVHTAIEQARRDQAERRERAGEARKNYDTFLATAAVPVFRMIANVLKSVGLNFEVMTPADGVRLQSDVLAHQHREEVVRGSRVVQSDRTIKGSNPLAQLTEDDVIEMLLDELRPWLT